MGNQENIMKLLDELKTERRHQLDLLQKLEHTYDELNRKGFRPLSALLQLINTWKQNLSLVEKQIREVESIFSEQRTN